MRRLTALVALAAAADAALAGCSGGSTRGAAAPFPSASTPGVSSPSTGAAAAPRTTAAPPSNAPCGWKATSGYRHVIWIWMENRPYASVLGSGSTAPRLSSYAARCGLATSYDAVTHPSLPNYLAATSGSTGGVSSDCEPASCPQRRPSLFGQIQAAGLPWRSYEESMPANCTLHAAAPYAPKHNPAAYFTPVRAQCSAWDVPMGGTTGAFAAALSAAALPAFAFVTPDLCDDGHDCTTSTADRWLGRWLDRITTSPAYRRGDTVVFVTWDEGIGSDQHIATVVIGPTVPPGTRVATPFTHYSLLRTTEELLGLAPLGEAASAASMRAGFHL